MPDVILKVHLSDEAVSFARECLGSDDDLKIDDFIEAAICALAEKLEELGHKDLEALDS